MYNLLIDKENLKGNIDSLSAEKDNMGLQICEYESLISQKEMLLEEEKVKSQQLRSIVDEHRLQVQVLQREKRLLHEQLLQPNKENMPLNQSVSVKQLPLPVQSVHRELEEIQEKIRVKSELLSPICGIPQASGSNVLCPIQDTDMTSDDAWAVTELLLVQLKQGTEALIRSVHEMTSSDQSVSYLYEQSGHFLLELNYLLELKNVWERQWGRLGRAVQLYTGKEAKEPDSEELPATEWLCTDTLHTSIVPCIQLQNKSSLWLTLILLGTLMFCPAWAGEHIWTVLKAEIWPHLDLHYHSPPPV
ncbi:hypothetical protein XENTR_v10019338 [Xenopus tropicalis]|nr:hypothetical protein XENTR_v10019338 [Xenopus tropicalis]